MPIQTGIEIHSKSELQKMRIAGSLAAKILDHIKQFVKPGVTTDELNRICHDMILSESAIPAPLHYKGFPKSICTSVNHVICHGIPGPKILDEGDIINIDVTVIKDGWHGDSSRMYFVGDKISIKARRLVDTTYDAMMLGIEQIRPGVKLNKIGKAIQEFAEQRGFSVVRDYCGHGIGRKFHTAPNILHYFDEKDSTIIEEGMFFTVEPMINAGGYATKLMKDGWTVITKDRSLSAQFEHTIATTASGFEILTESLL
ncbi:MAG: type I methionyl aminopeptidase [Proteobacteria bacterium]|nr:type I methionyl aminopeptidase [Pseudomonadota bacterium]